MLLHSKLCLLVERTSELVHVNVSYNSFSFEREEKFGSNHFLEIKWRKTIHDNDEWVTSATQGKSQRILIDGNHSELRQIKKHLFCLMHIQNESVPMCVCGCGCPPTSLDSFLFFLLLSFFVEFFFRTHARLCSQQLKCDLHEGEQMPVNYNWCDF